MNNLISVVTPAFNEEEVIELFYARMCQIFDQLNNYRCEIIFINDGSVDRTQQIIDRLATEDDRVCAISLSRNFGKEAAMTAGIDMAKGDAVVIFDVDLQDPPELIFKFVEKWELGYDVVYAKRTHRDGETWLKKVTASAFYRLMTEVARIELPPDTGDCRLMSRRVVDSVRQLREHNRFMKGLFAWVGYPSIAVEYRRDARAAGKTKFNYWRLWNFAIEGITSFSTAPLKLATYIGMTIATSAFAFGLWIIVKTLLWGDVVQGYPTLIVTMLFMGGVQLMFIGVLGEYLGRVFEESKNRPLYLISSHKPSRVKIEKEGCSE